MEPETMKRRGRPPGRNAALLKLDLPILDRVADLLLTRRMPPTTACRRVAPHIGPAQVRRLQALWKERGRVLMGEATKRRAARQRAATEARAAASPWTNAGLMAQVLGSSPWNNPAVMSVITGGRNLAASQAALKALSPTLDPARQTAVLNAVGFGQLSMLHTLSQSPASPLGSMMKTFDSLNALSKLENRLGALGRIGAVPALDAIMGWSRRKG